MISQAAASKVRRVLFASTPPTYCPIEPSVRTTRWQGTTTGMGLVAHAVPTARTAFGLPAATAMAEPLDDPPDQQLGSHGFKPGPVSDALAYR